MKLSTAMARLMRDPIQGAGWRWHKKGDPDRVPLLKGALIFQSSCSAAFSFSRSMSPMVVSGVSECMYLR